VLMLTQYLLLGGLERMIFNLAASLKSDLGWQPRVFVFDHSKQTDPSTHLGSLFQAESIPVFYYSKSKGFSFKAVLEIVKTLVREDIAVIHSHDLGALIYGAFAKVLSFGTVRLVHTQHSFVHLGRKKRYAFYEKLFARIADEIAVVSPDTRETYLQLGIRDQKIHFVPNGVRFAPRVNAKQTIRQKLVAETRGPDSQAYWILYMARIHGRKGQDHAMALWSCLHPEFRAKSALLFVGLETEAGQLEKLQNLMRQAPSSERVFYLGPTHYPAEWLQAADVFLSSSEFEGMPLASIEATGSGLPLLLSSIAGHEVLKPQSTQYPLEKPEEGAHALEQIISAIEKDREGYAARVWENSEAIRAKYSVSQMAKTYSKLYS
jgi:glycosyltransferase involved in cell wall biosynthesis